MASQYQIAKADIVLGIATDRLIQLTDDENTGAVNDPRVDAAIERAEKEFHRYAGVYYATPIRTSSNTIPDGIREFLIDSAIWRIHSRRPEILRNSNDEGEYWADWRKDAMKWLEALAASDPGDRVLLPGAVETTTSTAAASGGVQVAADESEYSAGFMR